MFTIFSLRKSKPFTSKEEAYMKKLLLEYEQTDKGKFLKKVDWRKFQFFWCYDMTLDNGVMGAFNFWLPNKIYLMPSPIQDQCRDKTFWLQGLFFTVVHQLRHAYQWKSNPLLYILLCLPLVREVTIQVDARLAQVPAQKWIQQKTGIDLYDV